MAVQRRAYSLSVPLPFYIPPWSTSIGVHVAVAGWELGRVAGGARGRVDRAEATLGVRLVYRQAKNEV